MTTDSKSVRSIHLVNLCGSMAQVEPQAAKLVELLDRTTYMDLRVIEEVKGGGKVLTVQGFAESEAELTGMVMSILASKIARS
jgi:hypothetical protein